MSKGAKVAISMIVILLLIAGGVVALLMLFNDKGRELDELDRVNKLLAPKNLAIDDNWVLSFDPVDRAIAYYVLIDGQNVEVVQETSLDVSAYATTGLHTFSVRAMHSWASYHSDFTAPIEKKKYQKLATPGEVGMTGALFYWGVVGEAKSYELLIRDDKEQVTNYHSTATEFSFEEFLNNNPTVEHFSVSVRATSTDYATGLSNEYILSSEYSQEVTYHRANTVSAPVIIKSFEDVVNGAADKPISWNVDPFVQYYELVLDGRVVHTINEAEYLGLKTFSLNLKDFVAANTMVTHVVYIRATPKAEDVTDVIAQDSNQITYTVREKLGVVNAGDINVTKEGNFLTVTWNPVVGASMYDIQMQGKVTSLDEYKLFNTQLNLTDTRATLNLDEMNTPYQDVQVRVIARGTGGYIDDGDWSDWSAAYSTITQLNSVGVINVTYVDEDGTQISWAGNNANTQYIDQGILGAFYVKVFRAEVVDGQNQIVGSMVFDFQLDRTTETYTISDKLKDRRDPAGFYAAIVTALPTYEASKYYINSPESAPVFFNYKTRLSNPSGIFAKRDESGVTMKFIGDPQAIGYDVTITGNRQQEDGKVISGTFRLPQPADFETSNGEIVDVVELNNLIGAVTLADKYNINITAVADEGEGIVLSSQSVVYTFRDTFAYDAVDKSSIDFTNVENKVTMTWAVVPDVRFYRINVNGTIFDPNVASQDVTSALILGDNMITIYCLGDNDLRTDSEVVAVTYKYEYEVLEQGTLSFNYNEDSGKIEVTVPQFDVRVNSYLLEFGDGSVWEIVAADPNNGNKAVFEADYTHFPLYQKTVVKVTAAVIAYSTESGIKTLQDNIITTTSWTGEFENDLAIAAPVIEVQEGSFDFTLSMPAICVPYIDRLEWTINHDGRLLYSKDLLSADFVVGGSGVKNVFEYNLIQLLTGSPVGEIAAGIYEINAKVLSTAGKTAEAETASIRNTSVLGQIAPGDFVRALDNSYLQWKEVEGATAYEVSAMKVGDLEPTVLSYGSYVVDDTDVIRASTIDLFLVGGVGVYTFTVVAKSGSEHISDSISTYTWEIANALPTPMFTLNVVDSALKAVITKNNLVGSYTITVYGPKASAIVINSNVANVGYETTVTLAKVGATGNEVELIGGSYYVSVVANPKNGSDFGASKPAVSQYTYNNLTAPALDGVSATQNLNNNSIDLAWTANTDKVALAGFSVSGVTHEVTSTPSVVTLGKQVRFTSIDGTKEYKVAGNPWIDINTDSNKFSITDSDLIAWLDEQKLGTFLVYFRTTPLAEPAGVYTRASAENVARMSYSMRFGALTNLAVIQNGQNLDITFDGLDALALGQIDVEIKKGDTVINTLRAVSAMVNGNGYKYQLIEELFDGRSEYTISVRASKNGVYEASEWASKTVGYATPIKVENIRLIPTMTTRQELVEGTGEGEVPPEYSTITELGTLTVAFDKEVEAGVNYKAVINWEGNATPLEFVNAQSLSVDDINTIKSLWVAGNEFIVTVTATPAGLQNAKESVTTLDYTVGEVAAPRNFEFGYTSTGTPSINITWTNDEVYAGKYFESNYDLIIDGREVSNNFSTVEGSELSYSNGMYLQNTAPHLVQLNINQINVREQENSFEAIATRSTQTTVYGVVNALAVTSASMTVKYNETNDEYYAETVTINAGSRAVSTTNFGLKYTILLGGQVVASDVNTLTNVALDTDVVKSVLNTTNTLEYQIIVSDMVTVVPSGAVNAGETLTGYVGGTFKANITLPVVIETPPFGLSVSEDYVASWSNVPFATKYNYTIKNNTQNRTITGSVDASDGIISIFDLKTASSGLTSWNTLGNGEVTLTISVAAVSGSVYVGDNVSVSTTFTKIGQIAKVNSFTINTNHNGKGDYQTAFSWQHSVGSFAASDFVLTLVSTTDSTNTYTFDFSKETFTGVREGLYYVYTYMTEGLDLINGTTLKADPTRNLPAGDYVAKLQIKATMGSFQRDSEVAMADQLYQNKFGVTKISESADVFAVLPDAYISSVVNGEIEATNENQTNLASYQEKYGFDRKYFVLKSVAGELTRAPSYRVWLENSTNGVIDCGVIEASAGVLNIDFSSIEVANKMSLNSWVAGENKVIVMPYAYGDAGEYYRYWDNGVDVKLDSSQALSDLKTEFSLTLYSKYATPSDPRIVKTYSDIVKHNLVDVSVSFLNSLASSEYEICVWYKDLYDGQTKSFIINEVLTADIQGSQNNGLKLMNYIRELGPHEIWFEVRQTGDAGRLNEASYINSDSTTTEHFIYTVAVPEFEAWSTGEKASVSEVATVSDDDPDLSFIKNGSLKWTLPQVAYDMQVKYTVTLLDENGASEVKTVTLAIQVAEGMITYDLIEGADRSRFYLDTDVVSAGYEGTNCLFFDMTPFFMDKVNRDPSRYYLAGKYIFRVEAEGLDKEGQSARTESIIYDPQNSYTSTFNYAGIKYPVAPENVVVSESGKLTWTYDSAADIYGGGTPLFGVVIQTTKADGTPRSDKVFEFTENLMIEDITDYLVAGGDTHNKVFVYRVSPNEYYVDSSWVRADISRVPASTMPKMEVEWSDKQNMTITLENEGLENLVSEFRENAATASLTIKMARLPAGTQLAEGVTYSEVINNSDITKQATIELKNIQFDFAYNLELSYPIDIINEITNLGKTAEWMSGANLIAGKYILEVRFTPNEANMKSIIQDSIVNFIRDVKDLWFVVNMDQVKMEGEFLTLKDKGESSANPLNQNDRNWAETNHREAILEFPVNTLADLEGERQLPSQVEVRTKLWNSSTEMYEGPVYSYVYNLPKLSDWNSSSSVITAEDVVVGYYYPEGSSVPSSLYYTVRIDLHKLYDYSYDFAANNAGVYHVEWMILEDENGSASESGKRESKWYQFDKEVCHYAMIATPILDYRLDMQKAGNDYVYVLNWALTPNQYTFKIQDDLDYNLNIYAFEKGENGYACDSAYEALSDLEKSFFLQSNKATIGEMSPYGFKVEYKLTDFGEKYVINDRRCYVNQKTNIGLQLTPNKQYKFFIYLSPKTLESNNPNDFYYLTSYTSAPQEYVYKAISTAHYGSSITAGTTGVYAVENESGFSDKKIYTIISNQERAGNNNAFELFIYDTQDPRAGEDSDAWIIDQEANKTYLSHFIISTPQNKNALSESQPLYIVENYKSGVYKEIEYRLGENGQPLQVGTLTGSTIMLYNLTIQDLLGEEKIITPITYYCKIKPWIDNNIVNTFANSHIEEGSGDKILDGLTIYGEDWIKRYITTDEELVAKYLENIMDSSRRVVDLADFNALNPGYYFTFDHVIEFAKPSVNEIQIINKGDADDVVGDCAVSFVASSTGATDGYISADSGLNYFYRIYLEDVYNVDPITREDKYINLHFVAFDYEQSTTGEINMNGTPNYSKARNVVLKVYYTAENRAYVELRSDSVESNASETFTWIDSILPNKILITATAVVGNNNQNDTGGANTANRFTPHASDVNITNGNYGAISRNFVSSDASSTVSIIIKKQYVAPTVDFLYDGVTSANLLSQQSTNQVNDVTLGKVETNVLQESSGNYSGMALNPYLFVDGNTYAILSAQGGANGYEYQRLSNNTKTQYKIVFNYNGDSSEPLYFNTRDINNVRGMFAEAVRMDPARYDYNNYKDIYPYEVACVYEALYNLVNKNSDATNYHGGLISATIQVVAPSDEVVAGYWVSSEVSSATYMYFSVRLETVKTDFDASKATFTDESGSLDVASMYRKLGYYYNYEGYIPFNYNTIYYKTASSTPKYMVYLTRENRNGTTLKYSYDILKEKDLQADEALWVSSAESGGVNTGNIANILRQDLFTSSETTQDKNQWLLGGIWSINILAEADSTMSGLFITRGFDSKLQTYTPKLKIVNDITNILVEMDVDKANGVVTPFSSDNIEITSTATNHYNAAASEARITYTNGSGGQLEKTVDITQAVGSERYISALTQFIVAEYADNNNVIGGKYTFSVALHAPGIENVVGSDYTKVIEFAFYRQISSSAITVSVAQGSTSDDFVAINASVAKYLTVSGINVSLAQTILSNNASAISAQKTLTRSENGDNYNFNSTWAFNRNGADCFSSESFSASEASRLINDGYVTNGKRGNLQAGRNTFYFYPQQKPEDAEYNLWKKGSYVSASVYYKVPSKFNPTVELKYATSSSGGESGTRTYRSGSWRYTDYYVSAYYRYVMSLSATFTNTTGTTVSASWTYGWKKNATEGSCTKTVFSSSGSSSSYSNLSTISLSGANYATFNVTIYCKSGFSSAFVQPNVTASISPDLSADHYEEYITETTKRYISSGSSSSKPNTGTGGGTTTTPGTGTGGGTTTPPDPGTGGGGGGGGETDSTSPGNSIIGGTIDLLTGKGGGTGNQAYQGTKDLAEAAGGIPIIGGAAETVINGVAEVGAVVSDGVDKYVVQPVKDFVSWINPFD